MRRIIIIFRAYRCRYFSSWARTCCPTQESRIRPDFEMTSVWTKVVEAKKFPFRPSKNDQIWGRFKVVSIQSIFTETQSVQHVVGIALCGVVIRAPQPGIAGNGGLPSTHCTFSCPLKFASHDFDAFFVAGLISLPPSPPCSQWHPMAKTMGERTELETRPWSPYTVMVKVIALLQSPRHVKRLQLP